MEYIETINAVSATEVGQKTKVLTCIKILSWLSSWEQIPVDASYSRFYSHNINQSISSVGTDCFGSLPIYMSITLRIKIWKEDKCDYLSKCVLHEGTESGVEPRMTCRHLLWSNMLWLGLRSSPSWLSFGPCISHARPSRIKTLSQIISLFLIDTKRWAPWLYW